MKIFKCGLLLLLCSMLLTGCKGDISTQALTEFKKYEAYFEGNEGCFVLYHNKLNKYWMYNGFVANDMTSPDETFEIYHKLIDLDFKLAKGDDLESVDLEMSQEDLLAYMEDLNYGNKDISGPKDNYWTGSSLKITPVQQVELLRRLYIKVLPYTEANQVMMKEQLFMKRIGSGTLYGKTSTGPDGNAWFIGFVERDKTAYFFATRLVPQSGQTGEQAKAITIRILTEEGLLGE